MLRQRRFWILKLIEQKTWEKLKICLRNGIISWAVYKKNMVREKKKGVDSAEVQRLILRTLGAKDFRAMCVITGNEFIFDFQNGIYLKHIDKLDKSDKMLSDINKLTHEYEDEDLDNAMTKLTKNYKPVLGIELPRGARKTTVFVVTRANYLYVNGVVIHKQPPVVVLVHGDKEKSGENLNLVQQQYKSELMQWLYDDILKVKNETQTATRFNLILEGAIKRKESHFNTASVNGDLTGTHGTYYLVDDWVTEKNTSSVTRNESNIKIFYQLFSLDDHSGRFKIEMAGTPYRQDSLYQDLDRKKMRDLTRLPIATKTTDEEGNVFWVMNFPEIFPRYKFETLRKILPAKQWHSQYLLKSFPRDETLKLTATLPKYFEPEAGTIAYRTILVDPALSVKNKTSEAVQIVVYITTKGNIHVVDGHGLIGVRMSAFVETLFAKANRHKIHSTIIETVSYQEALAQTVEDKMAKSGSFFTVIRHMHRINKRTHYKQFLEPLLAAGRIYINPDMTDLIDQIKGESLTEDWVDCLSFLTEININAYSQMKVDDASQDLGGHMRSKLRMKTNRRRQRTPFAVTGGR